MPITIPALPFVFGGQSGNVPASEIDSDLNTITTALSGVALGTADLANITASQQTWRNLVLRTHPDQDKAANQVALLRLDEIILDSGKRYSSLTLPITADITASGVGGLDTGARAASKWYEVHVIGKADGNAANLKLMFHLAKQWTLDQSQVSHASAQKLNDTSAEQQVAQKFTPGTTGLVEFVDLYVIGTGTVPASGVWVEIRTDNAGVPSSTVLATSDKLDASKFSTAGQVQTRFVFRSPASLTSATQYWLVVNQNYATSASNYLSLGFNASGTNQMYTWNGSAWAAVATATMGFREVVTVTSNLVYPAGYSDQAQIGWVYNNSGNALDALAWHDRRARRLAGGFATGSIAVAVSVPLLVDLSTAIPPGRITLTSLAGSVDTTSIFLMLASVPDGYALADSGNPVGGALRGQSNGTDLNNPTTPLAGVIQTEYQAMFVGINISHNAQVWINGWDW